MWSTLVPQLPKLTCLRLRRISVLHLRCHALNTLVLVVVIDPECTLLQAWPFVRTRKLDDPSLIGNIQHIIRQIHGNMDARKPRQGKSDKRPTTARRGRV